MDILTLGGLVLLLALLGGGAFFVLRRKRAPPPAVPAKQEPKQEPVPKAKADAPAADVAPSGLRSRKKGSSGAAGTVGEKAEEPGLGKAPSGSSRPLPSSRVAPEEQAKEAVAAQAELSREIGESSTPPVGGAGELAPSSAPASSGRAKQQIDDQQGIAEKRAEATDQGEDLKRSDEGQSPEESFQRDDSKPDRNEE